MIRRSELALILLQAYLFITAASYLITGHQPLLGFLDELLLLTMLATALIFPAQSRVFRSSEITILASTLALTSSIGYIGATINTDLIGLPATSAAISGILIDSKFTLFIISAFLLLDPQDTSFLQRLCKAIVIFGLLHGFLSLIDIVRGVDLHGRQLVNRSGLVIANGLFDHKYKSAFTNVLFFAAAMHLQKKWTAIFAFTLCILALSVKEMVAATLILAMHAATVRSAFIRFGSIATISLSIILLTITENPFKNAVIDRISTFVVTETSTNTTVRTELYKAAPKIAAEYFPFGSGAGSFGSSPSRDTYYSPLYQDFYITYLHGGGYGQDGAYLIDTFWPKIIGEYGFFGLVSFCIPLLMAARRNSAPNFSRYLFWALLTISIATPVYNYSDGAIFGGIATGLMLSSQRKLRNPNTTALPKQTSKRLARETGN